MAKKAIIILSILLGLSIVLNFIFFFTLSFINVEWENEYYNLDKEWCSLSNEYSDAVNDMLIELQYYDPYYEDIDLLINFDCWGRNEVVN